MNFWQPYIIAVVVGLLVGIERERSHGNRQSMGFRTFLLISLLGAIAGGTDLEWLGMLLAIFVFGLVAILYFTESNNLPSSFEKSLTTELAAGMVFVLGYVAHKQPVLSALLGPGVALLLFSKKKIHSLIRSIRSSELEAAMILLLMAVAILNLVPDKVIDPWKIFNPQKFGYLILTLGALEFLSYITVKTIGLNKGALAVGFLGGLVSSTAVTMSSAKQTSVSPNSWGHFVVSTIAGQAAALIVLLFIVFFVAPQIAIELILPVGGGIITCGIAIVVIYKKSISNAIHFELKSPLDLRGVLRLAFLLAAILVVASVLQNWVGESAIYTLSFVTGLFELHGISLANSTLFTQNQISARVTTISICIAVIASLFAKIALGWLFAKGRFAIALTIVLSSVAFVITFILLRVL